MCGRSAGTRMSGSFQHQLRLRLDVGVSLHCAAAEGARSGGVALLAGDANLHMLYRWRRRISRGRVGACVVLLRVSFARTR